MIFNIFNLLYNSDFVNKEHYGTFSLLTVIILLVSLFLIAFANMYFISGKAKELSIAILSGRSVYNVGFILTIQNMIICIIGIILGLLAGVGIMPIINTIVYKSAGLEVNPYAFSSLGFLLTSLIIIIQFVFMILVDMEYAYRKEIIDLIKGESNTIDIPITRTKDLEESIKLAVVTIVVIGQYQEYSVINTFALASFIFVVVILNFTIMYKFFIEAYRRKENFEQLRLMGYSYKEISKIILFEVIYYYFIVNILVLIQITLIFLASNLAGFISVMFVLKVLGQYIAITVFFGVISLVGYKKIACKKSSIRRAV